MIKIGRNDPCPCGSGKKFKKCCEPIFEAKFRLGEHERRMLAISRYAGPPPGSVEYDKFTQFLKENVKKNTNKHEIEKLFSIALAKVKSYLSNGAGLICDENIRYFFQETNDRLFNTDLWSFPTSFNVIEAFLSFDPLLNYFSLRDEKDFIFSFDDFMEFATSDDCINNLDEAISYLEDNKIYHFNNSDDLKKFTLKNDVGKEYGIAGISFIKHDDELSVVMSIGEITDTKILDDSFKEIYKTAQYSNHPAKKGLKPADDREIEAVRLCGIEGIWQNIILTRFDLRNRTQHVRYILADYGQSFQIFTDDPSIFPKYDDDLYKDKDIGKMVAKMLLELKPNSVLFELAKLAIYLPFYFDIRSDDIKIERHPTKLKEMLTPSEIKHHIELKNKIFYREVNVLKSATNLSPDSRSLKAPELKIETTGYWKRLSQGEVGVDKNKNPIHGKTWVERQLTWLESNSEETLTVYKKNDLKDFSNNNAGYVYVMRSAAHSKDIFKIGLTQRSSEIRSDELSRTTGSPDKFIVVEEWYVTNCVAAEKEIHERLNKYRVNPTREFFKSPYHLMRKEFFEIIEKYLPI